jgi:hypothetical protein
VIKKPGINLMSVLRLLGTQRLLPSAVVASGEGTGDSRTAPIGTLATIRTSPEGDLAPSAPSAARWEASLLVYNSNGTFGCSAACDAVVNLTLRGFPTDASPSDAAAPMLVHYVIDQQHGNPAALWRSMGGASNPYPTPAQFAALRHAAELVVVRREPLNRTRTPNRNGARGEAWGPVVMQMSAPQPSVHLVHVCSPPLSAGAIVPPSRVANVALRVTPTVSPPTVFVRWDQVDERCVQTYEVLWQRNRTHADPKAVLTRVNGEDLVSAAFVHAQPVATGVGAHGCYSVRATNYWGVSGPVSDEVCLPSS